VKNPETEDRQRLKIVSKVGKEAARSRNWWYIAWSAHRRRSASVLQTEPRRRKRTISVVTSSNSRVGDHDAVLTGTPTPRRHEVGEETTTEATPPTLTEQFVGAPAARPLPVTGSHSRTAPSWLAVASRVLPSGIATARTVPGRRRSDHRDAGEEGSKYWALVLYQASHQPPGSQHERNSAVIL
jgi:hypothetical protein